MIRRDYILRMIEEFVQALARLRSLKQDQRWEEAAGAVDEEFQRLLGEQVPSFAGLSETELLARLIRGEPTQVVRQKTMLLTTLLKEAGDIAAAQNRPEDSRACYLKGLHLLLDVMVEADPHEFPEFVPKIENLVLAIGEDALPFMTRARLMQHYERTGQFAKAEDALFGMLEAEPEREGLVDFGLAFYRRLEGRSDADLGDGNLTRAELEAGMAEWRRRAAMTPGVGS